MCIVHTVYENALLFSIEYYGASQLYWGARQIQPWGPPEGGCVGRGSLGASLVPRGKGLPPPASNSHSLAPALFSFRAYIYSLSPMKMSNMSWVEYQWCAVQNQVGQRRWPPVKRPDIRTLTSLGTISSTQRNHAAKCSLPAAVHYLNYSFTLLCFVEPCQLWLLHYQTESYSSFGVKMIYLNTIIRLCSVAAGRGGEGGIRPRRHFPGCSILRGENMEFWKLAVSGKLMFASQNGLVRI